MSANRMEKKVRNLKKERNLMTNITILEMHSGKHE